MMTALNLSQSLVTILQQCFFALYHTKETMQLFYVVMVAVLFTILSDIITFPSRYIKVFSSKILFKTN